MDELTVQTLIKAKYSGGFSQTFLYAGIVVQVIGIIVAGIFLWRASVFLQKKKEKQRSRKTYFETPYSKGWKRNLNGKR